MRVGTKSVLFGAHCFFIHPVFVAVGWSILFRFPWDLRLWAAFFLHDLGYLFTENMDGPEGEEHVHLGAKIMGLLFGDWWADFTLRHSRYWAKRNGVSVSKLCYADKLAFAMTPGWLYLPMARATGELAEYMAKSRDRQAGCVVFTESERIQLESGHPAQWLQGLQSYTRRWVEEHQGGGADTWTVVLTATQPDDGGIHLKAVKSADVPEAAAHLHEARAMLSGCGLFEGAATRHPHVHFLKSQRVGQAENQPEFILPCVELGL